METKQDKKGIAITTDQMKQLACAYLEDMGKAVRAFNHKWNGILSEDECRDLVMESYLQACRYADTYDPEKGSLKTWLKWIAHNKAYNYVKKIRREVKADLDGCHCTDDNERNLQVGIKLSVTEREQLVRSGWDYCEEVLVFEVRRKVHLQRECWIAAFQDLSEKDQTLLYMRYDLMLDEEEMARQRGMTHGALRTALSRARDRFLAELTARHFWDIDEWTSQYFHEDGCSETSS